MKIAYSFISVIKFTYLNSIRFILGIILILFLSSNFLFSQSYWGNEMLPNYSETLSNGEMSTLYTKKTIDVEGSLMYIVDYYGLTIADISNTSNPQILSRISTPGVALRVLVRNKIVYVLEFFGFTIVDATNSLNPQIVGRYQFTTDSERGSDLVLSGNNLYISSYENIYAFDVSNINNPALLSTVFLASTNYGIHITKHPTQPYLYCGANTSRRELFVVDVSNPSSMSVITSINLDGGGTIFSAPSILIVRCLF